MTTDPYSGIQAATRRHRRSHGCEAYTFEDGPALTRISAASNAMRILELGTALGYTACCLAAGNSHARVDTIECDPLHATLARAEIEAAGLSHRITVYQGDFEAVLPELPDAYDLIFFDGYAPSAIILDKLMAALKPGGTIACANVGLVRHSERLRLTAMLDDPAVWSKGASIEHGGTLIRIKNAAASS